MSNGIEMNLQPTTHRTPGIPDLTLVAFEPLPCGCVCGVYQASPTAMELELVEAKGPHCVYDEHRMGGVVRVGLPDEMLDPDDEAAA